MLCHGADRCRIRCTWHNESLARKQEAALARLPPILMSLLSPQCPTRLGPKNLSLFLCETAAQTRLAVCDKAYNANNKYMIMATFKQKFGSRISITFLIFRGVLLLSKCLSAAPDCLSQRGIFVHYNILL